MVLAKWTLKTFKKYSHVKRRPGNMYERVTVITR